MKKVFIAGYEGNMARRYRACLDYIGVAHTGVDIGSSYPIDWNEIDGIILATPTNLHIHHIEFYKMFDKPILCEKPISLKGFSLPDINIQMINQYEHCGPFPGGETYYDCWRTGGDGLHYIFDAGFPFNRFHRIKHIIQFIIRYDNFEFV